MTCRFDSFDYKCTAGVQDSWILVPMMTMTRHFLSFDNRNKQNILHCWCYPLYNRSDGAVLKPPDLSPTSSILLCKRRQKCLGRCFHTLVAIFVLAPFMTLLRLDSNLSTTAMIKLSIHDLYLIRRNSPSFTITNSTRITPPTGGRRGRT